jgi:HPt (histidine-containing phosphotransfer) domain-containing protein
MHYINVQQINKLRQFMSQEQLLGMIKLFFDPNKSGKDALSNSLINQDVDAILKNAHFIKGSSSFMGMQGIYDFCVRIDTELKLEKDPQFEQWQQEFESIWICSEAEANNTYASK